MSSTTIDYYFATMSPWTYFGHERFAAIARAAGAQINLCPMDLGKVFPVSGDASARLILAVDQHDGTDAAMALTGAVLRGVWADERNIADAGDLAAMLKALGLPERRLDDAADSAVNARYEANTQRAIELQVFGAPSYVIDGELFWGQDRLDFVERRLAASRS